jgi:hypothetical protein
VVFKPKQLHDGNIWHPVVINDFQLTFEIWSHKCGANSMMGLHIPIHCINFCESPFICLEWMWEPFHVG